MALRMQPLFMAASQSVQEAQAYPLHSNPFLSAPFLVGGPTGFHLDLPSPLSCTSHLSQVPTSLRLCGFTAGSRQ